MAHMYPANSILIVSPWISTISLDCFLQFFCLFFPAILSYRAHQEKNRPQL